MQKFKSLKDFITYCNEINENEDDSMEFFLISTIAATLTIEELLGDSIETLEEYYKWLKFVIKQENYRYASIIFNAKQLEMQHYIDLGSAVLKKNIKTDIMDLDEYIRKLYLD
jgi:hypothetical protein